MDDRDSRAGAPRPDEDIPRRITTEDEERQEWIDEDSAQDEEYRRAQSEAGGDATTPMTGRIPVGEVPPLDDGPQPGDLEDEIPSTARETPGTIDDVPYSLDEDRPGYKPPLEPLSSGDEETDLWQQQQGLIDEDRETSLHLEGFTDEEARRVMEYSADGAEPQAQGHSATGEPFAPEHGGFPERPEEDEGGPVGEDEDESRQ